ncbi:asparaginase [Fusobacterium perfoetens]|nr:asparaginase [Fusobacterium perfoetens]
MLEKVLIINTGGTIGMVHNDPNDPTSPLRPAKDWHEIAKEHPILEKFPTDYCQLDPLIDSSDMCLEVWVKIGEIIEKFYDEYRGFVILHGTDTMAFTASALSFMCKNLSKPIILTGSQVPLQFPRSDALQNLITAIQIAGNEVYGVRLVPEVAIFFRDTLLRGNRARKIDATNYFGFSSPNYPAIGEVGGDIKIIKDRILKPSHEKFYLDKRFSNEVIVLELFPGLNFSYLKNIFKEGSGIKGVILKTYGNGNAPTSQEFLDFLEYISSQKIVIIDITQCTKGFVKMGLYEASAKLTDIGVISGTDLTPEAAVTKLMYLLGAYKDIKQIKRKMQVDICGEQTLSQYDFSFESDGEFTDYFETEIVVPKKLKKEYLLRSVARVVGIKDRECEDKDLIITMSIESLDDYNDNFIEPNSKIQKIVKKDKKDAHILFDKSVKRILDSSRMVKITMTSNMKITWENINFSIYSELI